MTRVRKQTPTGDYSFGAGLSDFYINAPETIGQIVETSLLLWYGEYFLDTTAGTPYLQGIIGTHSQSLADFTIRQRVLNVEGVVSIEDYSSVLDPDTRKLSVSMNINTIYGLTKVEVSNFVNF